MERLTFVFFVYGLAFFAMGLAIALEARRPSDLPLRRPLWLLAAFGLLHAVVEWTDMWLIGPGAGRGTPALRIARLVVFGVSVAALAQFGADLLAALRPRLRLLRWLPAVLVLFWTANWTVVPHVTPVAAAVDTLARTRGSCARCHDPAGEPGSAPAVPPAAAPAVPPALPPLARATALSDVWLRYLLYLPGSLLAAAGFWLEGRRLTEAGYPGIAPDCRRTAAAFAANAVLAGLIVPPAPLFPATVLNYDRFLSVVGVPPQLFRAGLAVLIAVFTLRVLRVFEIEAGRRLAAATDAQLAAQREALAAVQAAREAAETWSRTLEERVAARTAELERRTRELVALNAIAQTVTASLDLRCLLEETLDRVLDLLGGEGAGALLASSPAGAPGIAVTRGAAAGLVARVGDFDPRTAASGDLRLDEGGTTRPFLSVPLRAKDRVLGRFVVIGAAGSRFGPEEARLLETVAQQVGVAVENARLFEETERRRREAETLYRLGTEITALSDLQHVLDAVTASARELIGADVGLLSLVDEGRQRLVFRAASGLRSDALLGAELGPGQGLSGRVVQTGRPLVVDDYVADPGITHELDAIVRQEELRTVLGVPVSARGRTVGCLAVGFRRRRPVTDDEVRLLARLAGQAAIAIENARLYEQVQSLAILEERDRLAREMHDSLGQSLGLLNLKTKLVEDLLAAGRLREAQEELGQVRQTIREAYDEVRHAIVGLRASGARDDLEVALRVQVTRFREQAGLPVVFEVAGPVPAVPAVAAVQITRIVQEALTNVRKHAGATEVRVSLGLEDDRLVVRVADNGRGFDVDAQRAAPDARFGLETMRERAESIGGTLIVQSAPGAGTTVTLLVPMDHEGRPGGRLGASG